jgi:hypothetical protein
MAALIFVIVWFAGLVGWILNIIEIISNFSTLLNGLMVMRIIGVFMAPLGAILGYI